MKIRVTETAKPPTIKAVALDGLYLDVGAAEVTLSDVYNGVGIETEQGLFGIAQRDGGVEVMLDGRLVWSTAPREPYMPRLDRKLDRILALLEPRPVEVRHKFRDADPDRVAANCAGALASPDGPVMARSDVETEAGERIDADDPRAAEEK